MSTEDTRDEKAALPVPEYPAGYSEEAQNDNACPPVRPAWEPSYKAKHDDRSILLATANDGERIWCTVFEPLDDAR